ncbi:unnamed protein product [Blepharisma stoltei]|uniref:Uncharacterized protein n=1 Tax=Blepharisma stoltei TaxID=1481888 RepID=A0AAU9K3B9_9CILI|nr:unnamed protein product [Blepharisma stoltei]
MKLGNQATLSPSSTNSSRTKFSLSASPYSRNNKYLSTIKKRLESFKDSYLMHLDSKSISRSPLSKRGALIIRKDLKLPEETKKIFSEKRNSPESRNLAQIAGIKNKKPLKIHLRSPQTPFKDESIQKQYEEIELLFRKHHQNLTPAN